MDLLDAAPFAPARRGPLPVVTLRDSSATLPRPALDPASCTPALAVPTSARTHPTTGTAHAAAVARLPCWSPRDRDLPGGAEVEASELIACCRLPAPVDWDEAFLALRWLPHEHLGTQVALTLLGGLACRFGQMNYQGGCEILPQLGAVTAAVQQALGDLNYATTGPSELRSVRDNLRAYLHTLDQSRQWHQFNLIFAGLMPIGGATLAVGGQILHLLAPPNTATPGLLRGWGGRCEQASQLAALIYAGSHACFYGCSLWQRTMTRLPINILLRARQKNGAGSPLTRGVATFQRLQGQRRKILVSTSVVFALLGASMCALTGAGVHGRAAWPWVAANLGGVLGVGLLNNGAIKNLAFCNRWKELRRTSLGSIERQIQDFGELDYSLEILAARRAAALKLAAAERSRQVPWGRRVWEDATHLMARQGQNLWETAHLILGRQGPAGRAPTEHTAEHQIGRQQQLQRMRLDHLVAGLHSRQMA